MKKLVSFSLALLLSLSLFSGIVPTQAKEPDPEPDPTPVVTMQPIRPGEPGIEPQDDLPHLPPKTPIHYGD